LTNIALSDLCRSSTCSHHQAGLVCHSTFPSFSIHPRRLPELTRGGVDESDSFLSAQEETQHRRIRTFFLFLHTLSSSRVQQHLPVQCPSRNSCRYLRFSFVLAGGQSETNQDSPRIPCQSHRPPRFTIAIEPSRAAQTHCIDRSTACRATGIVQTIYKHIDTASDAEHKSCNISAQSRDTQESAEDDVTRAIDRHIHAAWPPNTTRTIEELSI